MTTRDEVVRFVSESEVRARAALLFEQQERVLRALIPGADIQHVGSTSVPGSLTKGDVDIQVRIEAAMFAAADAILATHYERNVGSLHTDEYSPFKDDSTDPPLGIQLTVIGSRFDFFWKIRDQLLARPDVRDAYDALKRAHQGRHMAEYRAAKERFFAPVLEEFRAAKG